MGFGAKMHRSCNSTNARCPIIVREETFLLAQDFEQERFVDFVYLDTQRLVLAVLEPALPVSQRLLTGRPWW